MIILIGGYPGSGKSTVTKQLIAEGFFNVNRDTWGIQFNDKAFQAASNNDNLVIDNTFPTIESRELMVTLAKATGHKIEFWEMGTSIEDAQYNVCTRMIEKYGEIFDMNSFGKNVDPGLFGPGAQYNYKKKYKKATQAEGFSTIKKVKFERDYKGYTNKAIILDYDGTLRKTKSGDHYPCHPSDIEILPGRTERLQEWKDKGYLLLGVSNQSGIGKGILTETMAQRCFDETNKLVGHDIDYLYCKHPPGPIKCYCRKPMPGNGISLIEKYKLDPRECIMVGDMTSDETFAKRCHFKFINEHKFFI